MCREVTDEDSICVITVETAYLIEWAYNAPISDESAVTNKTVSYETFSNETIIAKPAIVKAISTKTSVETTIVEASVKAFSAETSVKAAIIEAALTTKAAITSEPAIIKAAIATKATSTMTAEITAALTGKLTALKTSFAFKAAAMMLCYCWKGNNRSREGRNGADFGQCVENAHKNTPFVVVALKIREGFRSLCRGFVEPLTTI